MEISKKSYDDYKYVMHDTGTISFGAKYSYAELIHDEDVNFKFKVIIERYLSRDLDMDTTLESHLYYLTNEGFTYECFCQLKAKVKINVMREKKSLFGKVKKVYVTQIMSIKEFVDKGVDWKRDNSVFIQELIISKLALMAFSA